MGSQFGAIAFERKQISTKSVYAAVDKGHTRWSLFGVIM